MSKQLCAFLNSLLPTYPVVAFDPWIGDGVAVKSGMPSWVKPIGFESFTGLKHADDGVRRVFGDPLKLWDVFDAVFPATRFECINSIVKPEHLAFTWEKVLWRTHHHGFGWIMSTQAEIERLKIQEHAHAYLYQKFPDGTGCVHWDASERARFRYAARNVMTLEWPTIHALTFLHRTELSRVRHHYAAQLKVGSGITREKGNWHQTVADLTIVEEIAIEESKDRPKWNVYIDRQGHLQVYFSTRFRMRHKADSDQIERFQKVTGAHALTFTTEAESRRLMSELLDKTVYSVEPRAEDEIRKALAEVATLSSPIMPVTQFELVAYTDEMNYLVCKKDAAFANESAVLGKNTCLKRQFTTGKKYIFRTESYPFKDSFTRDKPHWNGDAGKMYTMTHNCELSGNDRFISVVDDHGKTHRFMDRPQMDIWDHDEGVLWEVFEKPVVPTVAESLRDQYDENLIRLHQMESRCGFKFYDGQLDYVARIATKDTGVVAGETGTGKTLYAISLIYLKQPKRALIIAPQGTTRSSDEDEEDETFTKLSQWRQELHRFQPDRPVYDLFSMDDYNRIVAEHGGLPENATYLTYPAAFFINGARETAPDSWDDRRLHEEMLAITQHPFRRLFAPEEAKDYDHFFCNQVGAEKNGIRCILKPCMATLIGDQFDAVLADEFHQFTKVSATITQMLIRLQPKYRYGFSATPLSNSVADLFSLLGWIVVPDWYKGGRRNASFPYTREELSKFMLAFQSQERDHTQEELNRKAKGIHLKSRVPKVIKPSPIISSPTRILKIVKPHLAFISKKMCNSNYQPAKLIDVRVPLGTQQQALYAHFMDRNNIACANPMVRARKQITYLRNICADPMGFKHGGPNVTSNFNPKTLAILELVRDIIQKGDQFTIICARTGQSDTIYKALTECGCSLSRIDSTVESERHSHESNQFKQGDTQGMLMGAKSANSYSFDKCPYGILGSIEYSWGVLDQTCGRVDRINSARPATIYCVLNRHSIEEVQHGIVTTKRESSDIVLRGERVPRDYIPLDLSEVLAKALLNFKADSIDESDCESKWPELRETITLGLTHIRK